MVVVAQLVRVLVCGAEGRRFEPGQPPKNAKVPIKLGLFLFLFKDYFSIPHHFYQLPIFFLDWQFPKQSQKQIVLFWSRHQILFCLHRR